MNARKLVFVAALAAAAGAWAQDDMPMHQGMGVGMMGDSDAKVTKEEYMKRAEERFARLDVNKDGVIDATERKQLRQRMHECRELMGDMGMMGGGYRHMMGGAVTPSASTPPSKPKP